MRILIATNHLEHIGGSEVIALEFAAYFKSIGHDVDVYASWARPPMQELFQARLGVAIKTEPSVIFPLQFDFIYIQHQLAGLFSYGQTKEDRRDSMIVFGRLSRRSFWESGGWAHDNLLGDHTIANSELTATRLRETGVTHPATVFYNAAPAAFDAAPRTLPDAPRKILLISNHYEPALLEALGRLRERAEVRHLGRSVGLVQLATPDDIKSVDLVVSIGKSVQYALLAHTPVYVYDHFGGPGYLTAQNCDLAAHYSFSGRCCERKLSAAQLQDDILAGYSRGRDFARRENAEFLQRFRLEPHLKRLLALPASSNAERRRRIKENAAALERERMMAEHVRTSYVTGETDRRKLRAAAIEH
jgi:hypothetical protein